MNMTSLGAQKNMVLLQGDDNGRVQECRLQEAVEGARWVECPQRLPTSSLMMNSRIMPEVALYFLAEASLATLWLPSNVLEDPFKLCA